MSPFEFKHKLHSILCELKGFETAYTSEDDTALFIEKDGKVFQLNLIELGEGTAEEKMKEAYSFPADKARWELEEMGMNIGSTIHHGEDFYSKEGVQDFTRVLERTRRLAVIHSNRAMKEIAEEDE